jgi:hypothetical protein
MDRQQTISLSQRFAHAVKAFDFDELREVYADDIAIWHNFDEVDQTKEQGLRALAWTLRNTDDYRWDDIRIDVLEDGWVQRHVTTADRPQLAVPTMMRVWCSDDQIIRIEHYLDSARFAPLLSPSANSDR